MEISDEFRQMMIKDFEAAREMLEARAMAKDSYCNRYGLFCFMDSAGCLTRAKWDSEEKRFVSILVDVAVECDSKSFSPWPGAVMVFPSEVEEVEVLLP